MLKSNHSDLNSHTKQKILQIQLKSDFPATLRSKIFAHELGVLCYSFLVSLEKLYYYWDFTLWYGEKLKKKIADPILTWEPHLMEISPLCYQSAKSKIQRTTHEDKMLTFLFFFFFLLNNFSCCLKYEWYSWSNMVNTSIPFHLNYKIVIKTF